MGDMLPLLACKVVHFAKSTEIDPSEQWTRMSCGDGQTSTHLTNSDHETLWARRWV